MGRKPGLKYPSPLSLRLDDDLRHSLEKIAESEERPVGMMTRILLREAIRARDSKKGKKKAAKAVAGKKKAVPKVPEAKPAADEPQPAGAKEKPAEAKASPNAPRARRSRRQKPLPKKPLRRSAKKPRTKKKKAE